MYKLKIKLIGGHDERGLSKMIDFNRKLSITVESYRFIRGYTGDFCLHGRCDFACGTCCCCYTGDTTTPEILATFQLLHRKCEGGYECTVFSARLQHDNCIAVALSWFYLKAL